jgi:hypothetical protein
MTSISGRIWRSHFLFGLSGWANCRAGTHSVSWDGLDQNGQPVVEVADFLLRSSVLAKATASQRSTNFRATATPSLICRRKRSSCSFFVARILKLSLLALIYSRHLFSSPGF